MIKRTLCLILVLAALCTPGTFALADGGEDAPPEATQPPDPAPLTGSVIYAANLSSAQAVAALDTPCTMERDGSTTYFLDENGLPLSGWHWVSGRHCFFLADGTRPSGWTIISGNTYYFGPDGAPYTGLHYIHESAQMYLFAADGVLEKNKTVTLLGKKYTVDHTGVVEGYLTEVSPMAAAVLDQVGWSLRTAFNWVASTPYYDRENRAPEGAVHSDWYAHYGFSYRYGNCYVMAAMFYQMAKLLGYEVYYIEGGVGSATGEVIDHGWTEIVIGGQLYVFDPDFTNEEHLDGYQIWYEKPGTWWYYEPVRVD